MRNLDNYYASFLLKISNSAKLYYVNKDIRNQLPEEILIKKTDKEVLINFKKYKNLSKDIKIALINESVKKLKKNQYDLRSKKVENLIKNLNKEEFKKYVLGGCIFVKKGKNLSLKVEKR